MYCRNHMYIDLLPLFPQTLEYIKEALVKMTVIL